MGNAAPPDAPATAEVPASAEMIARAAAEWVEGIKNASTLEALRSIEVELTGRSGFVKQWLARLQEVAVTERKSFGQQVNQAKERLVGAIEAQRELLLRRQVDAELADATFDETLASVLARPTALNRGHAHPLSQVQAEVEAVFSSMGFHVLDYPEVESEFDNFEALNIPAWHPARDMQDTFWLEDAPGSPPSAKPTRLLRTHTSSGQVRAMHQFAPPFRAVFPGKVYRYEATDASHEHTFHQVEGLMIDRHVSVAHLLDSMRTLLSAILKREVEVRLRPGYFPFVEPGFELDISCQVCGGTGCSVCKQSGWLELLPCGLVHPQVLRAGGLDPRQWQGWAFGLGLSRLVMMRFGVPDVRLLLGGDTRFLSQF